MEVCFHHKSTITYLWLKRHEGPIFLLGWLGPSLGGCETGVRALSLLPAALMSFIIYISTRHYTPQLPFTVQCNFISHIMWLFCCWSQQDPQNNVLMVPQYKRRRMKMWIGYFHDISPLKIPQKLYSLKSHLQCCQLF